MECGVTRGAGYLLGNGDAIAETYSITTIHSVGVNFQFV